MATSGHYNHYDDPDEFWDEEPLQRARPAAISTGAPVDRGATGHPVPMSRDNEVRTREVGITSDSPLVGARFTSMELDRGFLPVGVEFESGWRRYVRAGEVGDELMRAYRAAVSKRMTALCSGERIPSPQEISDTAVPDHRTVLAVLLETTTWVELTEASSRIVANEECEVQGATAFRGVSAVTVRANRDYVVAIRVHPSWADSVDPYRISDELLWCADRVRGSRTAFTVVGDYSRYSDADLEYQLDRHRQRLFDERSG